MERPYDLRRSLRLRDLILYGIVLVQPTAPMPVFGVIYEKSHGHVTLTILLALFAMLFTAISYGRMARAYPKGGSAFLYVGKELHPGLGYVTGWGLILDYVINPLICTIWCSTAAMNFLPHIPYVAWVVGFVVLFTMLNCNGIETSARINALVAASLGLIIVWILAAAIHYIVTVLHPGAAGFLAPFQANSPGDHAAIMRGTAAAVLAYIGFDGISTLADEAHNPHRDISRAIVMTCFATGILGAIEVYFAEVAWPRSTPFPEINTAYIFVAGRVGGPTLFAVANFALLIATVGSGMASQLGAARLLYAMGRDGALPSRFFGEVDTRHHIPRNNVILIGLVCLVGALLFSFSLGADLLNFGALLAFIGVNLSSAVRAWRQTSGSRLSRLLPLVSSTAGFLSCCFLWWNLSPKAKAAGCAWTALGLVLFAVRRNTRQASRPS
ncbi:APC family permease [Terriglobus roseus]|uniref:Putrescine:proton symporter, AAT family n=1 Tax=Terriglobus roseus TaxID=392734 RepID=A0A1H4JUX1_9BACT|nr:APC family permease [Terriglobus roseus]SEB50114.1 putrescine:proton symporter, AAT family [Terriglobus roseus]